MMQAVNHDLNRFQSKQIDICWVIQSLNDLESELIVVINVGNIDKTELHGLQNTIFLEKLLLDFLLWEPNVRSCVSILTHCWSLSDARLTDFWLSHGLEKVRYVYYPTVQVWSNAWQLHSDGFDDSFNDGVRGVHEAIVFDV